MNATPHPFLRQALTNAGLRVTTGPGHSLGISTRWGQPQWFVTTHPGVPNDPHTPWLWWADVQYGHHPGTRTYTPLKSSPRRAICPATDGVTAVRLITTTVRRQRQ